MKIKNLRTLLLSALTVGLAAGCTQDDDYSTADFTPLVFSEDFLHSADNTVLNIENWTNVATSGTAVWKQQIYQGNGYAEFSSFQSGELLNVAWLVSPGISMDEFDGEKLVFQVSQSYVSSAANKLEVLVSTDYNGTDVATATWIPVKANLPGIDVTYFEFQKSGVIDLSEYTGTLHVAFKVTGSGTNTALDGSYQIDNVRVYY